jgi:hypothetical protein
MLIGTWHDNQVLINYIDHFLQRMRKTGREQQLHLQLLRNKLIENNHILLQSLLPKMEEILSVIFPPEGELNQGKG